MPKKELIIALSNSTLKLDRRLIPMLWQTSHSLPDQAIDLLLTALEASPEDNTKILNLLLAEMGPAFTLDPGVEKQRRSAVFY